MIDLSTYILDHCFGVSDQKVSKVWTVEDDCNEGVSFVPEPQLIGKKEAFSSYSNPIFGIKNFSILLFCEELHGVQNFTNESEICQHISLF